MAGWISAADQLLTGLTDELFVNKAIFLGRVPGQLPPVGDTGFIQSPQLLHKNKVI